ncbi:hypothetical protein J0A71_01g01410 [Encephalitozoon cuniculi]|nr:hypothetical protein J0A71_01g01410 [Encephalitozoon cuniculi]
MDIEDLIKSADNFFRGRPSSNPMVSSKKKVLRFAKDNGVDMNKSLIKAEEFPRSAYADELERFPVLRD